MSDKNLTEAEWKKFAKGRDLKDAGLLKALGAYEKAKGPEEVLKALAAVEKEADALRKFVKGDKDFGAQLDGIDKAIAKEEKQAKAEQKEAESQQQSESEEEESPALLTSKMVPLLRQVRKGEVMQVLIANAGKEVAVLLSRRAISPTRRKLLQEYLQASTVKPITGTCVFEENAYTFVVQSQASGLAKKLKAALLAQVELRLKVRVRGEDGELDDDGEPAEDEAGEQGGEEDAPAPQGSGQPVPPAPGQPTPQGNIPPAPPLPPDPLKAQFDQRLAQLEPQALAALKAQQGDVSKIRAVAEFAREKGATGQYKAGLQALESLAKLLPAPQQQAAPQAPSQAPGGPDPAVRFNARLAQLMPQLQAAIKAAAPQAAEMRRLAAEAGELARKKEFERGHDLLDELLGLLESPAPGGETEQGESQGEEPAPGGPRADYEALRARVEPDIQAALAGSDPALADKIGPLRAAWEMAQDSAAAGNHERALLILKRLAEGSALKELKQARQAAPAPKVGPSLVEQRKFMLTRWARIPTELRVELDELGRALSEEGADASPDELTQAIGDHLDTLLDGIKDELDDAITAGDMGALKGLRNRVEQDELIVHLQKSPVMDGSKFKRAVFAAMDEIEAALTA